jgi:hypothetical protein
MTESVRVQVTAEALPERWRFTLTCSEGNLHCIREVAAYPEAPFYPRPGQVCGSACEHRGICAGSTSGDLFSALERLNSRQASGDAVGQYLFDTLLGADWPAVTAMGEDLSCEIVELALTWPYLDQSGDPASRTRWAALSQLPWELMRDGANRCLSATGRRLSIAVTRVVAGTPWKLPSELPAAPRVLFVVGTSVTDPAVRAGAEMLALLRAANSAGYWIRHRILDQATPAKLTAAMDSFRPDIVHVISHGEVDQDGRGRIMLRSELDASPLMLDGDQLVSALRGPLPAIVVLSACDSGGNVIAGPLAVAPLATELVHRGIPVVVAMAGKVSDRTSRVFTRYFGQALANGKSLVAATAQARRHAFAEANPDTADWALPSIFFSDAVQPSEARRADDPSVQDLSRFLASAQLNLAPVFCAREDFLQTFWTMLGGGDWGQGRPGRPSVLAVCVPRGLAGVGKTRLLQELARQALQNGHLPLRLGIDYEPPSDVNNLAGQLAEAMRILGAILGVGLDFGRELLDLYGSDRAQVGPFPGQEIPDLADRLGRDADQLRAAAEAKYPELFTAASRVVILIDNVGAGCDELLTKLFAQGGTGLNDYGLGAMPEHPVPLVLTILTDLEAGSATGRETGIRARIARRHLDAAWLVAKELEPFRPDGEDMLAYEQVLLNPLPDTGIPLAMRPWVFKRSGTEWNKSMRLARSWLKGMPHFFRDEERFGIFLDTADNFELLDDARDHVRPEAVG